MPDHISQCPQFKRQCRALGVARWPARKMKSVRRAMEACADPSSWLNTSPEARAQLSAWAGRLAESEVRNACELGVKRSDSAYAQRVARETLGQGGVLSKGAGAAKIIGWTVKQRHAGRLQPARVFRTVPGV